MKKNILKLAVFGILFVFALLSFSSCEEPFTGTYKVYDGRSNFYMVLNNDGSVRLNKGGKGETYGSWEDKSIIGYIDIDLDSNSEFIFGLYNPYLDLNSGRLYFTYRDMTSKHPQNYYKTQKIK